MTDPIQLADRRILGTLGQPRACYGVRVCMHEVHLRDGSLHRFHGVLERGVPSQFLRALQLEDGRTYCIFDLRHLAKQLATDLLTCAERDVPGLISFTMRGIYPHGLAMRRLIGECAHASGVPVPVAELAVAA